MKILITGAEGFIGQHLSKRLSQDHEVFEGDIRNPISSIDITEPIHSDDHFDVLIHLASKVNVELSRLQPEEYFNVNVNGTLNLLKNVSFDHFIFGSSSTAANPISPYGLSKRMAEILVEDYCKKNNKNFSILRFHNVLGNSARKDSIVAELKRAEETGIFYIYGDDYDTPDGTAIRDFTHVTEVCNGVCITLTDPANRIEEFGHGIGTSVKELVDIYKTVNKCDFKVEIKPRRPNDLPANVSTDPSKRMKKIYPIEELVRN